MVFIPIVNSIISYTNDRYEILYLFSKPKECLIKAANYKEIVQRNLFHNTIYNYSLISKASR